MNMQNFSLKQSKNGIEIYKMAQYEPINKVFTIEQALKMWMHEEPGCYDFELDEMMGTAGGMLGRGNGFWFNVAWWKDSGERVSII